MIHQSLGSKLGEDAGGGGDHREDDHHEDEGRHARVLLGKKVIRASRDGGGNHGRQDLVEQRLNLHRDVAEAEANRAGDADDRGDEAADHGEAEHGGGGSEVGKLLAEVGDELHTLLVAELEGVHADPEDGQDEREPDAGSHGVALDGHVGGDGAHDGRDHGHEQGVADAGERSHGADLQVLDGVRRREAVTLLHGHAGAEDDGGEPRLGVVVAEVVVERLLIVLVVRVDLPQDRREGVGD